MKRNSSSRRSRLSTFLRISVAIGFGFVLSSVFSGSLHERINPHRWLEEHESNRLYFALGCGPSERAVQFLRENRVGEDFVVIPVDTTSIPERDEACKQVLQHIQKRESVWWLWLPETYLCDRLTAEAWNWSISSFEGSSPGFVVEHEVLDPGFGDHHVERLLSLNKR